MTITHEKALEVYKMYLAGVSYSEIMQEFKISYSEVKGAINYWKDKYKR